MIIRVIIILNKKLLWSRYIVSPLRILNTFYLSQSLKCIEQFGTVQSTNQLARWLGRVPPTSWQEVYGRVVPYRIDMILHTHQVVSYRHSCVFPSCPDWIVIRMCGWYHTRILVGFCSTSTAVCTWGTGRWSKAGQPNRHSMGKP